MNYLLIIFPISVIVVCVLSVKIGLRNLKQFFKVHKVSTKNLLKVNYDKDRRTK